MYSSKSLVLKFGVILVFLLRITLRVYGGGDPTCPSDAFPTRLTPGGQGRVIPGQATLTVYKDPFRRDPPVGEITSSTQFRVSPNLPEPQCAEAMLWVSIETEEGLRGWVTEVVNEAYVLEPIDTLASLPERTPQTFESTTSATPAAISSPQVAAPRNWPTPLASFYGLAEVIAAVPLIDDSDIDKQPVYEVAIAPDGETLITASFMDETFRLWSVKRAQLIRSFTGHRDGVTVVAFSPNGRLIVSGGADNLVKLWDAETGDLLHTLRGHGERLLYAVFSPDGQQLATVADHEKIIMWDIQTGEMRHVLTENAGNITQVAFSPDSQKLLTLNFLHMLIVWNAQTGEQIASLSYETFPTAGAAFLNDNDTLFVIAGNQSNGVWNPEAGDVPTPWGEPNPALVALVPFSTDRWAALKAAGWLVRIDLETGEASTLSSTAENTGDTSSVSLVHQILYKTNQFDVVELWDVETKTIIKTFQGSQITQDVWEIYGYDRNTFVTLHPDGVPYIWSVTGFEPPLPTITRTPTLTPTSTLSPTPTSSPTPTASSTSLPVYCSASPPSRIQVGILARVTLSVEGEVREDLRVREAPGGERIGAISEGTRFRVTDNYQCANDLVWWPIETLDGSVTGWVTEGAAPDDYYIEPVNP